MRRQTLATNKIMRLATSAADSKNKRNTDENRHSLLLLLFASCNHQAMWFAMMYDCPYLLNVERRKIEKSTSRQNKIHAHPASSRRDRYFFHFVSSVDFTIYASIVYFFPIFFLINRLFVSISNMNGILHALASTFSDNLVLAARLAMMMRCVNVAIWIRACLWTYKNKFSVVWMFVVHIHFDLIWTKYSLNAYICVSSARNARCIHDRGKGGEVPWCVLRSVDPWPAYTIYAFYVVAY